MCLSNTSCVLGLKYCALIRDSLVAGEVQDSARKYNTRLLRHQEREALLLFQGHDGCRIAVSSLDVHGSTNESQVYYIF